MRPLDHIRKWYLDGQILDRQRMELDPKLYKISMALLFATPAPMFLALILHATYGLNPMPFSIMGILMVMVSVCIIIYIDRRIKRNPPMSGVVQ